MLVSQRSLQVKWFHITLNRYEKIFVGVWGWPLQPDFNVTLMLPEFVTLAKKHHVTYAFDVLM